MQIYRLENTQIAYENRGSGTGPAILWAHGWGQDHKAFLPLVESLERLGRHTMVDFPGFGASPPPQEPWGAADYADAMARFIKDLNLGPVVWVGHSFGCRVGLQMAARHPDLIAGLFLMAAAGLPRKRPIHKKLYIKGRIAVFKALKKLIPLGLDADKLYKAFGSTDYKSAGPMRQIFVKVVNENLTSVASQIKKPVTLAYGTEDTETPLEIGQRFNKLIARSELLSFENLDHYSILSNGRHQVAPALKKFIEQHGSKNVS